MNPAEIENQPALPGDVEDNIPASMHVIMAIKSLAHAAKDNPSVVPHIIGIAKGLDVMNLLPPLLPSTTPDNDGMFISPKHYAILCSFASDVLQTPILTGPANSVQDSCFLPSAEDNTFRLFKKPRTDKGSASNDNTYEPFGSLRDRVYGDEHDFQLLETDGEIHASNLHVDYPRQTMPDLKRPSFPATSFVNHDPLTASENSVPITSLKNLDCYIDQSSSSYTTSIFQKKRTIPKGESMTKILFVLTDKRLTSIESETNHHLDFIALMNLCSTIVDEETCPFQDQSLLIFDRAANQSISDAAKIQSKNTEDIKYPASYSIAALVVMERSPSHWQLYLGRKFGSRDHMSIPTGLLPHIVRSINLARSAQNLQHVIFTFISSAVLTCALPEFEFYYALIEMSDISDLLMETAIETTRTLARKNGPGERRKNKRGRTTQFSQGLQNAAAHSQYLARWSMVANAKPIPSIKTNNGPTEEDKENLLLLHHLSIELCKKKLGISPFQIPDTCSKAYKEARSELRIDMNRALDPSGKIERTHQFNQAETAEHITNKGNECLKNHHDKKNCPFLDTTLSLTTLHHIDNLLGDQITEKEIHKYFDVSRGMVAANLLGYTRSNAHHHSNQIATNRNALASENTDDLTRLCIRLLSETDIPVDYQGYLWENEESFDERASNLAKMFEDENPKWINTIRDICGEDRKILRSIACFEKLGFYSIFVHVLLSLHAHGYIKSKWDVRCLCYYFGLIQNGTSVLVAVWDDLIKNKRTYIPFLPSFRKEKGEKSLLILLNSCERRIRLSLAMKKKSETSCQSVPSLSAKDHTDCKNKIGSNPFQRFGHGINSSLPIIDAIDEDFIPLFEFIESVHLNKATKLQVKADLVLQRAQQISGVGAIRAMQFLHTCCLSQLLPVAAMLDHVLIADKSAPALMLRLFYGNDCNCSSKFHELFQSLKTTFGFTKLTKFFLENMLCEMKRIAVHGKFNTEYLLSEKYYERVRSCKLTKNADLYFEDYSTGKFQHIFRVNDRQLEMRVSTITNDPGHSPITKVNINYTHDGLFIVDIVGKELSECFGVEDIAEEESSDYYSV